MIAAEIGFFVDNEPGRVPQQKHKAENVWQGMIFLKNKMLHMQTENTQTSEQRDEFRKLATMSNEEYAWDSQFGIHFTEDKGDSVTTHLLRANRALGKDNVGDKDGMLYAQSEMDDAGW